MDQALWFADNMFVLTDATQGTAHFLKVEDVMLDVISEQIVLAKIAANKSVNHLGGMLLIERDQPCIAFREPVADDGYQRFDNL